MVRNNLRNSSPANCCWLQITVTTLFLIYGTCSTLPAAPPVPIPANTTANHPAVWEYAVSFTKEIVFFSANWTELGRTTQKQESISAIIYDEQRDIIYFHDLQNKNGRIFALAQSSQLKAHSYRRVVEHAEEDENIRGMAFDPVSHTLFWTDAVSNRIYKLDLNSNSAVPQVVQEFAHKTPLGIAVDVCRRKLYWTTGNDNSSTVERDSLAGGKHEVLISRGLKKPIAIEIDQESNRMYWIDRGVGTQMSIVSANLQGGDRQVLYRGANKNPRSLIVTREQVLFVDYSDDCVFRIDQSRNNTMDKLKVFDRAPKGILVRPSFVEAHRDNRICAPVVGNLSGSVQTASTTPVPPPLAVASPATTPSNPFPAHLFPAALTNFTALAKDGSIIMCLNGGHWNETRAHCECKRGYSGDHCETNWCYNFCVHGNCELVSGTDQPQCRCERGYTGIRCDRHVCDGHCLNDGRCDVPAPANTNDDDQRQPQPVCTCLPAFTGRHCEMVNSKAEICRAYCVSGQVFPNLDWSIAEECNCQNITTEEVDHDCRSSATTSVNSYLIYGIILAVVLTVLLLVLFIVSGVRKCYKPARPKIRKTYVVRKNMAQLTNRPNSGRQQQCEITIEDCCNMQYCETPCFDPKQLDKEMRSSSSSCKDDRKELLGNIVLDSNGDLF